MRIAYLAVLVASLAIFNGSFADDSDDGATNTVKSYKTTTTKQSSVDPDNQVYAVGQKVAAPDSEASWSAQGKCILNTFD